MARGIRKAAAPFRTLIAALVVFAIAPVATASGSTKTFHPVAKTRHALLFAPKAVDADQVEAARVKLRSRRTGGSKVRAISAPRVRKAIERGTRLRIRRGPKAAGHLTVITSTPSLPAPPPPSAVPTEWLRSGSFETSLSDGVDGSPSWQGGSPFAITRTNEVGGADGVYAAKIVTNGGDYDCSCPRVKFEHGFSLGPGEEVWISGSWYVTDPSKLNWSRFMNLGSWSSSGGSSNWYLALETTSGGTMQVGYANYADPKIVVLAARPIPANRWFRVDLHFKLSTVDGQALTEWYLDGQLVGSSTKRNMFNSNPLHFYNAGLSFFHPSNGNTTVYFDAPRMLN